MAFSEKHQERDPANSPFTIRYSQRQRNISFQGHNASGNGMITTALAFIVMAQGGDPLAMAFKNPPPSARPHTWWHWMDGNVTKEGITADLEAMKEVGIGGAQMFTVAQGIPKGPVDYMSQQWRDMTAHAVKEAGRLGIELCLHNCAGWSSSGGPWITPENAMQVVAWSETTLSGPRTTEVMLPPIKAPQTYANIPYSRDIVVYAMPKKSDPARDPQFLGRTGVNRWDNVQAAPPVTDPAFLNDPKSFIDLTDKVGPDGKLNWEVPLGTWTILRIGHVPTGKNNHPAPPEGDGLEVDKLSREALDSHWDGIMAKVIADSGPLVPKVLNNALVDSYEVGGQNWTKKMREEFKNRRGYDLLPFLPAICGKVIVDSETTERFLWDFRRTIADLFADHYFGYFAEKCHEIGMDFSTEPYGNGGFDNIQVGGTADIPMGEFWVGGGTLETTKLAASVGHVYGRQIIGAESFTADDVRGRYLEEPYAAKALGDLVFTHGINRYIFHRYAHQPWMDLKPGMTMGPWGTHLERTQTWWKEAGTWMKYIARCQYLLQSGRFVADALYYTGEGAPVDLPYGPALKPKLPSGYDYDGIDTSLLMKAVVKNNRVILPSGMSYAILILPESTVMTLPVVQKIRDLTRAGATVFGPRPTSTPGLVNHPTAERDLGRIATDVWGDEKGVSRAVGKGRVFYGASLEAALTTMKIEKDLSFKSLSGGTRLAWIHRRINGADVYFVSNQNYRPTRVDVSFRVKGMRPQLWHADTGVTEDAPIYRAEGNRTAVTLALGPAESVFVVFRPGAARPHVTSFGPATDKKIKDPVVVIKKARYETAAGQGVDVTATVTQLVKEGNLEIPATNTIFGDPVVNVVKHLVVEYTLDGKPIKKIVPENGSLILLELPNTPIAASAYDLTSGPSGLTLTAWKVGKYAGRTAGGQNFTVSVNHAPAAIDLSSGWNIAFPPNWGAPASIKMDKLGSWTDHTDKGVKYFSGSAVYIKTFTMAKAPKGPYRLDLGRVKNFATVKLNGKELDVLWKEPFVVDATSAVRAGENNLEIKITNLWVNRLIGDEQLTPDVEWTGVTLKDWPEWMKKGDARPKTGRLTFTTWKFWNKDSPLLESGLLGPVILKQGVRVPVQSR